MDGLDEKFIIAFEKTSEKIEWPKAYSRTNNFILIEPNIILPLKSNMSLFSLDFAKMKLFYV